MIIKMLKIYNYLKLFVLFVIPTQVIITAQKNRLQWHFLYEMLIFCVFN